MNREQEIYNRQRLIDQQKQIVTYKSSTTLTSEAFIWTYRATSCDVISIITTTVPLKDGLMKDIKLENREIKRLKPAPSKVAGKVSMGNSPFESEFGNDSETKRKKLNNILMSEKRNFMAKLNISRYLRSKVENSAATKIQSLYRGHYTRISMVDIEQNALVSRKIRSNIRSFLSNKYKMQLSMSSYKMTRQSIRNQSATLIQCLFLLYLSRKGLRRRRREKMLARKLNAAIAIQSIARGASARARVKLLVERIYIVMSARSALRIQTVYRALIARRKVSIRRLKLRMLASRTIQNWFRAIYCQKMTANIKKIMHEKKTNKAAIFMQGLVRAFVSRKRVNRIRLRRLHKVIFKCVTVIQCLIRKFLAKISVAARRDIFMLREYEVNSLAAQAKLMKESQLAAEETKALLESVDIFLQARRGNTLEVEDIFKGLVSTEDHTVHDVEVATGDNLLTIAASTGNMDLLRKCLLWGFDINHRNDNGQNVLILAVLNNHYTTLQYILAPKSEGESASAVSTLDPISHEDMGVLLVAAASHSTDTDFNILNTLLGMDLDVNAKDSSSSKVAIHAACEKGTLEVFKLLMKYKANLDAVDDLGQTPLHKSATSSLKISQLILGLDPNFNTYMSDLARVVSIVNVDGDGKDCILHAALSGQTDVVDLFESLVKDSPGTKSGKKGSFSSSSSAAVKLSNMDDIGWTPNDVSKVIKLVESGNLICLKKVIDIGFDPNWPEENTGATLASTACRCGDLDSIDMLMSFGADFSVADATGRSAIHYAVLHRDSSIVVHLLTHVKAKDCNVSEKSLTMQDSNGENVFHLAARDGVELNIELLARNAIPDAMKATNKSGLTPLLLAFSYGNDKIAQNYITLGADALAVDSLDRGCLWHVFHRHADAKDSREEPLRRRPCCSELVSQSSIASVTKLFNTLPRKDKDDDVARLAVDIQTVMNLLSLGCTLYSNYGQTAEEMLALPHSVDEVSTSATQSQLQPGDIIVQELSISLIKNLLNSNLLSTLDAWRLLLSSLRFDDGKLKVFNSLLRGGIIGLLTQADRNSTEYSGTAGRNNDDVTIASAGTYDSSSQAAPSLSSGKVRQSSVAHLDIVAMNKAQSMKGGDIETFQLQKLADVYFLDLNLVGWIIKLGHVKALQLIVRKGFDTTLPVDTIHFYPCLHFVAQHGVPDMVEVIVTDKRTRLEQVNINGETAGMVAAKYGRIKMGKRLFDFKVNPRKALDGRYAAWVLAHARKREKNEINLQTGRFGDDDILFFDISPDPLFVSWYSE